MANSSAEAAAAAPAASASAPAAPASSSDASTDSRQLAPVAGKHALAPIPAPTATPTTATIVKQTPPADPHYRDPPATESALVLRQAAGLPAAMPLNTPADADLLVPRRRRGRRKLVLEEDVYVASLEKIVERQFFPHLAKLRAQSAFLTALENGEDAAAAAARYGATPAASVARFGGGDDDEDDVGVGVGGGGELAGNETPAASHHPSHHHPSNSHHPSHVIGEDGIFRGTPDTETLSLDAFLSRYTSEDNESFEEIVDRANERVRERYQRLLDEVHKRRAQLALTADNEQKKQLALAAGHSVPVETWRYVPRNALMYPPTAMPLSAAEQAEANRNRKEIHHANTRFKSQPYPETLQGLTSAARASLHSQSAAQSAAQQNGLNLDEGADSPRINGYGFVVTPSPMPGRDADPLMTWGVIEGSPFPLDGSDVLAATPGPMFQIQAASRREQVAQQLAEEAASKHRKRHSGGGAGGSSSSGGGSGSHSSKRSRLGSGSRTPQMSPAAQRLASGLARRQTGLGLGMGSALRASYSPAARAQAAASATPGLTPRATTAAGISSARLGRKVHTPRNTPRAGAAAVGGAGRAAMATPAAAAKTNRDANVVETPGDAGQSATVPTAASSTASLTDNLL